MSGGTQGTFPDEISANLRYLRNRTGAALRDNGLNSGGIFCNLEHVASVSLKQHIHFFKAIGHAIETDDKSDKLLSVEEQLKWLKEIGFVDVDCYWKWLEMALLAGYKT